MGEYVAMPCLALTVKLTEDERATLERWLRSPSQERRLVERAQVVLLAAEGVDNRSIGVPLGFPKNPFGPWRSRFAEGQAKAPQDMQRSGRKRRFSQAERL